MTSLWSRRPWWLVDTVWLIACIATAAHHYSVGKFGWFGADMAAIGLLVSSLPYQWLLRKVTAQRDDMKRLVDEAIGAAQEQQKTLLFIMPVFEEAAAIVAERSWSATVAGEKSN